jgi:succinoglycan biosynthesis transport protein ExoP
MPDLMIRSADSSTVAELETGLRALNPRATMEDGIGLDACWHIIRRHVRMIIGFVVLAVTLVGTAVYLMTPCYVAKSTLLIEPEQPQLLDVRELVDASGSTEDHDYYRTEFELLKSRDLAARVISELDLTHNQAFNSIGLRGRITNFVLGMFAGVFGEKGQPVPAEDAETSARFDIINHYLDGLKIEPVAGTRLVTVSYTAPDHRLAALIVNRHVHDYVKMGIELRAQAGKSARDFLAGQLVEISRHVENSEAALNAYRHRMGIVSFGVDEKNGVAAQRMADLNKALTDVETKRMNAEAEMTLVRSGDYESLPQVVSNPAISALEPEVRNLQAEYARLSQSFNPGFPKLDETKAQLDAAQRALNVEVRDVAKSINRSYIAAEDEEQRLQAGIDAEKAKDLAIDNASLGDAVLVREVETNQQLYKNVLQRMQEMDVTEQAPLSNISIVDNAVVSRFPASPKRLRDITIAGLLALMAGIGAAFFTDQQDDRLHTVEELEELIGLPSLAIVPDFSRLGSLSSRRKPAIGVTPVQIEQAEESHELLRGHFKEYHPRGYIAGTAETYRMIRTSLLFSRPGSPPRSIIISSAIKGEGKTSTAANTALVYAHTGALTLLVDADLRRPNCHSLMNETNHVGLSDVLAGQLPLDKAIRSTSVENLFLLTAGSAVPNPAELLTSNKMREIIGALQQNYDTILIDTAPLMLASETCVLATMVDGLLLVVGACTPKRNVQRACQRLKYVGAKVLGVVLNRVNIHEPGRDEFRSYYLSYGQYEAGADY